VPWQQIYFEVPFYLFMIVPMSMLFSWKLAYENFREIITFEDPIRQSVCSAESLDHDEYNTRLQKGNTEPLLPPKKID
jgi:hypothetical protein